MRQGWTCTGCNAKWITDQPKSIAGTMQRCGKCGASVRIPLECPECHTKLLTPGGDVGGMSFRCPGGHVFKVPLTRAELLSRFSALGSIEGEFDQSGRLSKLPDRHGRLKERVDGGYCAVMCLDWIRRVRAGGGRPTYHVADADKSGAKRAAAQVAKKEEAQTLRGAYGWVARYDGGQKVLDNQLRVFDQGIRFDEGRRVRPCRGHLPAQQRHAPVLRPEPRRVPLLRGEPRDGRGAPLRHTSCPPGVATPVRVVATAAAASSTPAPLRPATAPSSPAQTGQRKVSRGIADRMKVFNQ